MVGGWGLGVKGESVVAGYATLPSTMIMDNGFGLRGVVIDWGEG